MTTTHHQILDRIHRQHGGDGAVVTPKDFLDLAGRDAVDQALARLVKRGFLQRICRGLYHLPRSNKRLGIAVPPDADKVANALGRQTGSRIAPTAAVAANRLGLSTQIPAKPVYLTSGRNRTVRVGSQTFRLKHASLRKMPRANTRASSTIQVIDDLGRDLTDVEIAMIGSHLSADDRRELLREARYHSERVADIARRIAACKLPSDPVSRADTPPRTMDGELHAG